MKMRLMRVCSLVPVRFCPYFSIENHPIKDIARKAGKAALKSCCFGAVSAGAFTLAILCTMTYQPPGASDWSVLSVVGNTSYLVSCGTGIGAVCHLCVAAGAVVEGVAACVSKKDGDDLEKIE
jgi:hypothetical protein